MVTELGYCNLCEKQKMICKQHHCSVCYELYCEDCYYETIYENDELCKKCIGDYNESDYEEFDKEFENEDIEKFSKTQLDILKQTVKSLQLQNETFKKNQCLLIALETIDLRDDITRENIIDIKYTIKELLYNNSSDIVDNDVDLYKTIIEELSGLQLNYIYVPNSYSYTLNVM
jgi:hypothetical protein